MPIHELTDVLPPPKSPIELGKRQDWPQLERELGLKLPADWCDYALTYGSGYFGDRIYVSNPLASSFNAVFNSQRELLQTIKQTPEIGIPYDIYPERPGLFPCAHDDNGHDVFWLTEGEPEEWPIILRRHEGEYERWNLSLTSLFASVLANKIRCITWPRKFSKPHRIFVPRPQVF